LITNMTQNRRRNGIFVLAIIATITALPMAAFGFSTTPTTPTEKRDYQPSSPPSSVSRRRAVSTSAFIWAAFLGKPSPRPARANAAGETKTTSSGLSSSLYTRHQTNKQSQQELSYKIELPSSMVEGSKPLKTHLDEVNFTSDTVKGYQYGVTVDPVRIASIKEVRK
jgi:hypothetical protein